MFEPGIDVGVDVGFNLAVDVGTGLYVGVDIGAGLYVGVDGEFVLVEVRKLLGLSVVLYTFELLIILEARLDDVVD